MPQRYKRIVCKDGFSVSVQASETSYCAPRYDNQSKYTSVELGFPSDYDELIIEWAEDKDRPSDTVYGWVPASVVNMLIAKHGGLVEGTVPPGIIPLYCKGYEK